jgi:hypothetical protein
VLGEQGTEWQHCRGGDAVGDCVVKWSRIQRHGTITVNGVTASFDKPLYQHGQLLLNLGEHLGRIAVKPREWHGRRSVDELTRVALDHATENVLVNVARSPVAPREVARGYIVEAIRRKFHVELVVERIGVHNGNEPGSSERQIQLGNVPQQSSTPQ